MAQRFYIYYIVNPSLLLAIGTANMFFQLITPLFPNFIMSLIWD